MNRRSRIILGLVLLVAASCDRGSDPPGLEGAGPLVAEFARVAKGLDDVASAVAARSGEDEVPGSVVGDMTDLGEAARAVLHAAEPDGPSGAAALSQAVADAANDVVRHLVTAAGGHEEGPGRMVLDPPATVAFDTDAKVQPPDPSLEDPPGRDRSELGKVEAQERLQGALHGEIEHFVYVALLAHPGTRAALARRLSPDDLPAEVPDDLNLPVGSREEWREELFDDQNRLVVPSPYDVVAWRSFIGWTKVVNPALRLPVSDLTSPATRFLR